MTTIIKCDRCGAEEVQKVNSPEPSGNFNVPQGFSVGRRGPYGTEREPHATSIEIAAFGKSDLCRACVQKLTVTALKEALSVVESEP